MKRIRSYKTYTFAVWNLYVFSKIVLAMFKVNQLNFLEHGTPEMQKKIFKKYLKPTIHVVDVYEAENNKTHFFDFQYLF